MESAVDLDGGIGGVDEFVRGESAANSKRHELPNEGRTWRDIHAELVARKVNDYDWRSGRVPIYVYYDDEDLLTVSREAYNLYFTENALGRRAFPSLAQMESDVIDISLELFGAPAGADGSFTSGGTESIFLAMKTARDYFLTTSRIKPKVVAPRTAHPAFDKAAHYLQVDIERVGVDQDGRCDLDQLQDALDKRVMMIVGSAPCYPYGVFDPIEELGGIAAARGLWLHVDACLGGFLAPFARRLGYEIPSFDFEIPGVSSLSADLHKFGFSARGASMVMYRTASLKAHQVFEFDNWPRGSYATETFLGSRPGGAIASAWGVMHYLGWSGYRKLAKKTMDAAVRLRSGLDQVVGLEVHRPAELNIVVYQATDPRVDINAVADVLLERGWFVGRMPAPPSVHLALNPVHAPIVESYLEDVAEAVASVRKSGRTGTHDDRTY